MPVAAARPDYDRLERLFQALAYSSRLELLHQLRTPRALAQVRVTARMSRPGEQPGRIMSRQATKEHLDRLLDADLVHARETRGQRLYEVNGQRLYEAMEEFRRVGTIVAGAPLDDETRVLDESSPALRMDGEHLVVVHGLVEGRSFPLTDPPLEGWRIGRGREADINLDYDPYVSQHNATLTVDGDKRVLHDAPSSRNGTTVNWRRIEAPHTLRPGDVIGVGGTLLVYRT